MDTLVPIPKLGVIMSQGLSHIPDQPALFESMIFQGGYILTQPMANAGINLLVMTGDDNCLLGKTELNRMAE